MSVWWLLTAVFAASWVLTLLLRRYAVAKSLLDIPNERSSHSVPTPRGGGVAIVISFLLALPCLSSLELLGSEALYGLLGSGLFVAVIGWADDHGHIAVKWRLLGHFVAAAWALYWLNGFPPMDFFGVKVDMGWFGNFIALIYLVWMLNLYNFMDGIDGLASAEAISVCLGMCLVNWIYGSVELVWGLLALVAAVCGFFCWNIPPARIFMGDAGSGFLGLTLGVIGISLASNPLLFWSWVILLGVFVVDATFTLIARFVEGAKIYDAHRSHAYQYAVRRFDSHAKVVGAVILINVLWLLPISILVAMGMVHGVVGVFVAYTPLVLLVYKVRR